MRRRRTKGQLGRRLTIIIAAALLVVSVFIAVAAVGAICVAVAVVAVEMFGIVVVVALGLGHCVGVRHVDLLVEGILGGGRRAVHAFLAASTRAAGHDERELSLLGATTREEGGRGERR